MRRLVKRHRGSLVRYAQSLTRDAAVAHDLVQEALLKLWDTARVEDIDHGRRWLYQTVRHLCLDRTKVEGRRAELARHLPAPQAAASPGQALEADRLLGAFLEALGQLPLREQEVVRLKLQADLSYKEIAEVTELSVANVGYLLHQGMERLKLVLSDHGAEVPPKQKRRAR